MWLEAPQERCLLQRLGCSWQRTFPVCHPAEHPPGQDSPVFQPRHGKVEEPEPSNKPCCPAGPSGEGSVQQRVRISCAEECQGSRWLQSQTPLEVMPSVPLDVHTALVYLRLPCDRAHKDPWLFCGCKRRMGLFHAGRQARSQR